MNPLAQILGMVKSMRKLSILVLPIACFSLLSVATGCEKPKEKQGQEHFGPNPGDGADHDPTVDE